MAGPRPPIAAWTQAGRRPCFRIDTRWMWWPLPMAIRIISVPRWRPAIWRPISKRGLRRAGCVGGPSGPGNCQSLLWLGMGLAQGGSGPSLPGLISAQYRTAPHSSLYLPGREPLLFTGDASPASSNFFPGGAALQTHILAATFAFFIGPPFKRVVEQRIRPSRAYVCICPWRTALAWRDRSMRTLRAVPCP